MKYKFFIIILFFFILYDDSISNNVSIKFKIENKIVTNLDIENEAKYLAAVNNNLGSLPNQKLLEIATNSIIQEKIKIIELEKYFDLKKENQEVHKIVMKNLYSIFRLENKNDLINLFLKKKINLEQIIFKHKVDFFWNKMIFDRYIKNVNVNKEQIKEKLEISINKEQKIKEFFLSEILFDLNAEEKLENKYEKIMREIKESNFSNAANIFGISNSSKNGGKLGWIKENQLSEKILANIQSLEIGMLSNPIQVVNGYLILRVEEIRVSEKKVNFNDELDRAIQIETEKQLNQYSLILFNRIKKNILIDEI